MSSQNRVVKNIPKAANEKNSLPSDCDYSLEPEDNLMDREWVAEITFRYHVEDEMMAALCNGDEEKVMKYFEKQAELPYQRYHNIRYAKTGMYALNTMCRREAARAHVHPAYIDKVSQEFVREIGELEENAEGEAGNLSRRMLRKYCLLIRSYSLRSYTNVIQNAINYIDFNYDEPLSLSGVADALSVNAKYLSNQFKKELGKTITDFINEKRIQESMRLLATTELPVREIAERVGILDENYYSRLFKKYADTTPSAYRKAFKSV